MLLLWWSNLDLNFISTTSELNLKHKTTKGNIAHAIELHSRDGIQDDSAVGDAKSLEILH